MENQNTPVDQNLTVTGNGMSGKKIIIVAIAALVALFLIKSFFFSPERMTERTMEKMLGSGYDVSTDKDGNYNITGTGELGASINVIKGKNIKVPENWPASIPIPAGVNIVEYNRTLAGEARETTSKLVYSTNESIEKISNLYQEELVANGWIIDSQFATGDGLMLSATQGEKDFVSVYLYLGDTEQKTNVTITVQTIK